VNAAQAGDRWGELVDADQRDARDRAGTDQGKDHRRDTGGAAGVAHAARASVPDHLLLVLLFVVPDAPATPVLTTVLIRDGTLKAPKG
jgi:hypothetical protein